MNITRTTKGTLLLLLLTFTLPVVAKVKVKQRTPQTEYAAQRLNAVSPQLKVTIDVSHQGPAEGFTISHNTRGITIMGNDGSGAIYGANRLLELWQEDPTLSTLTTLTEAPQMVMRGACVGLQKTVYLPGHTVYEYPYTPENFPWFYDKELWVRYLDLLASANMNTVYLWNGHPFASLVKVDDYPFATEVDDTTMQLNQDMFGFLVDEADRRGIRVIQMFYNIILSKPFADHYGLKTQDRHRPITPLISDYTRKSIAAFVKKYPKVGFLICLGEAMDTIEDDIAWMTGTIIPGILDGMGISTNTQQSALTSLPPIILRSHDTDGPRVLKAALPLYPNIYTMSKYTGESLTTYEPGGPWGETHRQLADAAPVHIDNVHILANLEPWRWASPAFIQKAVQAMHSVHHATGLHLYPQASYWDWPYTADKLEDGSRLLQIERDWLWYRAWGRYAWNAVPGGFPAGKDTGGRTVPGGFAAGKDDAPFWQRILADYYGTDKESAALILSAYNQMGEIAPKLLRRFGITEGNRQTLLLGMTMAQLVNPYKFNIYPGFYESCGPKGEKLIEWAEKEFKGIPHEGELPLDITQECLSHAAKAKYDIAAAAKSVTRHQEEFNRLRNDIACYDAFAKAFQLKVQAASFVLKYKWGKDLKDLSQGCYYLERSLDAWRDLVKLTQDTYLYANSMQTAQRRIPVGGDNGHFKTWADMLPVYEAELAALRQNIERLKNPAPVALSNDNVAARPADVTLTAPLIPLNKGALLFENRADTPVDTVAPELAGLQALVLNRDTTRIVGTTISFSCKEPVKMLVGFFQDDDPKWAKAPKLETDATGNEYGQAEPLLTNAVAIKQMPPVHIHAYHFPEGHHTIRLPKGIIMVAGFTADDIKPRDAALQGAGDEVDWLFRN